MSNSNLIYNKLVKARKSRKHFSYGNLIFKYNTKMGCFRYVGSYGKKNVLIRKEYSNIFEVTDLIMDNINETV